MLNLQGFSSENNQEIVFVIAMSTERISGFRENLLGEHASVRQRETLWVL